MDRIGALTDVDPVDKFFDAAKEQVRHKVHLDTLGHISACCAGAGIAFYGQLWQQTNEEMQRMFLAHTPPIGVAWVENLELLARPRRFRVLIIAIDSAEECTLLRVQPPAPKFIGKGEPRPPRAQPSRPAAPAQPSPA